MPAPTPDYSLYLVTGRELLPPGVDYYESLDKTLSPGKVTIVQVREKDADNGEFLEIAQRSLEICDKYSVPMLVNDNLSVVQCLPPRVGLHIGQDDIPIAQARQILGPDRLIGISVHTIEHAKIAVSEGIADYAGVGPVYGTQSKAGITDDKVLSPRGAANVVAALRDASTGRRIPSVLIGGINTQTAARSLVGASSQDNAPDGIAVISAIVARRDPDVAARELAAIVESFKIRSTSALHSSSSTAVQPTITPQELITQAASYLSTHRSLPPQLIQTLTSHVSSTMSANIALAFSSSPIMSHQAEEAEDLGKVVGGVVLNIGTISEESRRGMKAVGAEANRNGKPIVLDPVGVGASSFRKRCVDTILNETQVTLIKGNAAELSSIAGLSEVASRGVDSGAGSLSDPVGLVRTLAKREKCLVLLTGKTDYLSDGHRVVTCDNGHPLAGKITGTGCALGVMLSAGMATAVADHKQGQPVRKSNTSTLLVDANHDQVFLGALVGLLTLTIASEKAAERKDVQGPGSFIPALIDEIANLTGQDITHRAKIQVLA